MALRPKLFVTVYINVFILRNINKDLITINYIVLVNLLANISRKYEKIREAKKSLLPIHNFLCGIVDLNCEIFFRYYSTHPDRGFPNAKRRIQLFIIFHTCGI